MIVRRKTRQVKVGSLTIGGEAPISIQSMTKTDTTDIEATVRQIRALATAGCEIVRVAVPTIEAAKALPEASVRAVAAKAKVLNIVGSDEGLV
jgi:(E)-4-hydroxy-3-methylbut-2-enyl-diphosphate synthase